MSWLDRFHLSGSFARSPLATFRLAGKVARSPGEVPGRRAGWGAGRLHPLAWRDAPHPCASPRGGGERVGHRSTFSVRSVQLAAALVLPLSLAGCFRPLYGPTASGIPLRDALAAIEVEKVASPPGQERIGHYVRSELIFNLDGSGTPSPKRYKLALDAAETIQPISVDTQTGRADAALLNGTVKYALTRLDGKKVLEGTARANATYYRDQQRFASVRAARDADIRVAGLIAEDIKQRLAAYMATTP